MTRIIIAGSRDFNNFELLKKEMYNSINKLKDAGVVFNREDIEFISGHCWKGADKLGEIYAKILGFEPILFPAEWYKYDESAGTIRNEQMAVYASRAEIGICIVFWDGKSNGSRDMARIARHYNLYTYVIKYNKL